MTKIEANVSGVQGITAKVVGDGIVATVGGVGPQGPSGTGTWEQIAGKPTEFPPSEHQHVVGDVAGLQSALDSKQAAGSYAASVHGHIISDVTGLQTALNSKQPSGSYVLTTDASVTNAREWSAATVSQADAEAGTSTSRLAFTPLRVFQAIAAWWAGSSAKAKLDGIASGATANQTDAYLLDRGHHTGQQTASTISDFTAAVIAAAPPTTNASLLVDGTLPDARLSSNIARTSDVTAAVAAVVDAAPASLDTLNELAAALGDDANFASTVTNALAAKAPVNNPTFTGTVSGVTKSMVGLGSVPNVDATARANHTGTQDASTIGSGTIDFARLPFTVTYPVRAVHAGGVLSFDNWAVFTTPTYFWGGSPGDLRALATMEYPATSVSVDVSASATKYIADNPGRTLTYSALEVVLVDAANRIVGWGTTSTNQATGPSNGTGGTSMTLSLLSFPTVSAANWVIGGLATAGNVTDITPITAYKHVASRHLDIEKTDWANIPNKPTFAAVATSGSAADLTGTLPDARLSANIIRTTDARLSDQRHPLSLSRGNTANYAAAMPFPAGASGGPSAYATFGQAGGVWEWTHAVGGLARRGGSWGNTTAQTDRLSSAVRVFYGTYAQQVAAEGDGSQFGGFRVATLTNPLSLQNFVAVGDAGNAADATGYGAVAYQYQIGSVKVTNADYVAFLNAIAATDTHSLYSDSMASDNAGGIVRSGSPGSYTYAAKAGYELLPVVFVGLAQQARYCNWLHNGRPTGAQTNSSTESGAYTIPGNASLAPTSGALYRLPTEDEWYKAAYYKGGSTNAGYWLYATQSNTPPDTALAPVARSGSASDLLVGTLNAARIPSTTVTAGSYGSASSVGTFTVDAAGRLTAAGSAAIAISAGSVSGLADVATAGTFASLTSKPTTLSGYGITDAVAATDARLSDARLPSAHKATHATGGADALTPSDIGAASLPTSGLGVAISGGFNIANGPLTYLAEAPRAMQIGGVFYRFDGKWISTFSYNESTFSTTGGSRLTSLALSDLEGVGGGVSIGGTSLLTSLSLPSVAVVFGAFSIVSCPALSSLSLPSLLYCGSVSITTGAPQEYNFPSLRYVNGSLQVGLSNAATYFSAPLLEYTRSNLTISSLPLLTSISLPMLNYVGGSGLFVDSMPLLTTASFPSLAFASSIGINFNSAMTTLTFDPAVLKAVNGNVDCSSNALSTGSVDNILSSLAVLDGTNGTVAYGSGRTVNISGGTNAAPTSISTTTRAGSSFVCSGTTCTVNWTGHGYATGDVLRISGITTATNANRYARITVVNANQFTYTITSQTATGAGTATVRLCNNDIKALVTRGVTLTTN